jgi:hypothetical protein
VTACPAISPKWSGSGNSVGLTSPRNLLSALDVATAPTATRFCREALALDRRLFGCGIAAEAIGAPAGRRSGARR